MNWFERHRSRKSVEFILPVERQVGAWRRANRRMGWKIPEADFRRRPPFPVPTPSDEEEGFIGVILAYGFGRVGDDASDAVLSGKLAWEFACRRWSVKTWQCRYIDFDQADHMGRGPGRHPDRGGSISPNSNLEIVSLTERSHASSNN